MNNIENKSLSWGSSSGRSPLFAALRRALRLARLANQPCAPPVDELIEIERESYLSRRELLRTLGALLVTPADIVMEPIQGRLKSSHKPRIVIVGAGIAGLTASYYLRRAGYLTTLYEATERVGGRIFSAKGLLAPELVTELGAEFIDSTHQDMLTLVRQFQLELIDFQSLSERALQPAYFFNGQHYKEAEIIAAFRPVATRIEADRRLLNYPVTFKRNNEYAVKLDNTNLADYLHQIGATGWLYKLLEVAYVSEGGLDIAQQSCLNLVFLIETDLDEGFEIFGESDERYKVRGGNQQIVDKLAHKVQDQLELEHRLVAIRNCGKGFTLTFEKPISQYVEAQADIVLLCIPFTILREVKLEVELPPYKWRAIRELGYGMNSNISIGFRGRPWREQGYNGTLFTDESFQSGWDDSRLQDGITGGLTLYFDGTIGSKLGTVTSRFQIDHFLSGLNRLFPGVAELHNGRFVDFHWPTHPFAKGSYPCYKPGQWTSIAGAEFEPIENLFFAGDHTSYDFQGYMNGAAQTGRLAAEKILKKIRARS